MKIKLLSAIFLTLLGTLSADIEEYFKPCLNKGAVSSQMRNIDFIYCINLDKRPEKYAGTLQQLAPYNIVPYRFSAVNGWELSLEDINKLGVKYESWMQPGIMGTCYLPDGDGMPHHEIIHVIGRNYFCHCMARGPMGCSLSHLSVLQDAYDSGYETIWIIEDDIQVIQNPHLLSNLTDRLDSLLGYSGWDILFTDQDTKNGLGNYVPCLGYAKRPNFSPPNPGKYTDKYNISHDLKKIGARYGTYSMIVRRSGIKKMLDFFKTYKIFLPIDMDMFFPDLKAYAVTNDVVSTQVNAPSDNGAPNYKNSN